MDIKKWFETKDYGIGLAILGTYSKNRILLQNLSRKRNPAKLEYELLKIAKLKGIDPEAKDSDEEANLTGEQDQGDTGNAVNDQSPAGADQNNDSTAEAVGSGKLKVIRGDREVKFDDLPEELQARWNQNRDNYKEIRATHEKLKLMENATPEDRQPLTARIAELDDQVRANWEVIDARQPDDQPEGEKAPEIDHKRINANRKYISTNLKKLQDEGLDEVKAAKIRDEIRKRYNELKLGGEQISKETDEELVKLGFQF